MALTAERKLTRVVIDLMRNPLFADMSGIFMMGTKEVSDDIPTAATNGRDEVYGRAFIDELSIPEVAFVVVHESFHKMYRHLTTWHKLWLEDPQLTNMACDYVINLEIVTRDPSGTVVAMPQKDGKPIGLIDQRFKGMNTKQVFDILKKQKEEGGKGPDGSGKKPADGEGMDHHDWEGANELTKDEKEELAKQVDQAIRQGMIAAQKMHGKGAGGMSRELSDILEPKVDWRTQLQEFVSSTCAGRDYSSWRKPNRRFLSSDVIMPSLVGERVKNIVIGCDTSGSITDEDHTRNLSETDAILSVVTPDKLHIIYWDHTMAGHEVYDDSTRGSFRNSTKPVGGGGTNPAAMEAYHKEQDIKADCIIMFTDGYVPNWGTDWNGSPILWVITGGGKMTASTGKTIHVD
jgi:predicted metal-dependent peptidase